MKGPRHDPAQRFTCARCTRCCRHFDVAVTEAEVLRLRRPDFARLWSEAISGEAEGGAEAREAVEPLPGGLVRIRRRRDGTCGFLAEDGACRIHAAHGAQQKPLTCRIFPLRVHPSEGGALVTATFSCPTVARNEGEPLSKQLDELGALVKEWRRAFPEAPAPLRFAGSKAIPGAVAGEMKAALLALLDRRVADGRRDLRANVARMATLLDDWTRHRVLSLPDDAFADYVRLTGRFAVTSDQPASVGPRGAPAGPSALGRLLRRGFLLGVVAARLQASGPRQGLRLRLRSRLARAALHLHGLWPPTEGLDRHAARRVRLDLDEPALHAVVHHYLRSTLETLPTGRGPVVDELAWAFATLDAAARLAAARAAREGRTAVVADDLVAGLAEAADLGQAGAHGLPGRLLGSLTGGIDALRAFAGGPEGGTA